MTEHSCDPNVLRSMLKKAKKKLEAAQLDFESEFYDDAVSHSYYAVFHAVSAVLAENGLSFTSHTQTIGAFNREYVKSNVFPTKVTRVLQRLFEDRQIGDYSWTIQITRETAEQDFTNAKWLVNLCQEYLENKTQTKLD